MTIKGTVNFTWRPGVKPYRWPFPTAYSLIHKPTDLMVVGNLKSAAMAKAMAEELEAIGDWSFTDPDELDSKTDMLQRLAVKQKYEPEFVGPRNDKHWEYLNLKEERG